MFGKPLRRDPLVVGWVVVVLAAAAVVLDENGVWSGHVRPALLAGTLRELADVVLWSFLLLLAAAWLRARLRRRRAARHAAAEPGGADPTQDRSAVLPWTDRWLRDWREEEARHRTMPAPGGHAGQEPAPALTCRHGMPVDVAGAANQPPILRALSVGSFIVPRGGRVSVTWCFQHCRSVVVDGRGGYPACGEAPVPVEASRRIEVVGHNRHGSTPVATACVVAMDVPQLDLPSAVAPPPVVLRTDVAATLGPAVPVARRLDDFWATRDRSTPPLSALPEGPPARLVGVPAAVVDRLRRARRWNGEESR